MLALLVSMLYPVHLTCATSPLCGVLDCIALFYERVGDQSFDSIDQSLLAKS